MKKEEFKKGQIIINNQTRYGVERGNLILITEIEHNEVYGIFQTQDRTVSFVNNSSFADDCELLGYTDAYQYVGDIAASAIFTVNGKYQTLYPEDIERSFAFVDNNSTPNGWYGDNSTKFKPVWPSESYLETLKLNIMPVKQTERKLIGYKLSGKASAEEIARILNCSAKLYEHDLFFGPQHLDSLVLKKVKELGVLDIWFIPVFEDEIEIKFKEGDFIHISNDYGRFSSHPEFRKIMDLSTNEFLKKFKDAPKTDVIEFIKYSKFSNCDNIIIGKMNGFYYAFGNVSESKRYRIATPDEVTKAKSRKFIGSFEIIKTQDGGLTIGCQTFSKEEINTYKRITTLIINNNITLSPETIINLI